MKGKEGNPCDVPIDDIDYMIKKYGKEEILKRIYRDEGYELVRVTPLSDGNEVKAILVCYERESHEEV
ncbi:MAG: hypothetical protein J7K98_03230 [Candidatus Aenigmarchaeota archaeon]|nr:hypothetical protein [Candidatus Aenigmarchaeota archaeon]